MFPIYPTSVEAKQALAALPDRQKYHVEPVKGEDGTTAFMILDNAPPSAKKGKAAAEASLVSDVKATATASASEGRSDRLQAIITGGPVMAAGRLVTDSAKAVGEAISAAGKAKPGWFKPEYLGPIGILPGPVILTPEARTRIKKALDEAAKAARPLPPPTLPKAAKDTIKKVAESVAKAIEPAVRPLTPPTLSPEAKARLRKEIQEASKHLGPIHAAPGVPEALKAAGKKVKDTVHDAAETLGKAIVFGPFLPGVLIGEAIARKR